MCVIFASEYNDLPCDALVGAVVEEGRLDEAPTGFLEVFDEHGCSSNLSADAEGREDEDDRAAGFEDFGERRKGGAVQAFKFSYCTINIVHCFMLFDRWS